MAAFRILDQDPVYFDLQGNLAIGGHLRFYESGTVTPKSVYGNPALTVNNGAEVLIGSDGRAVVDIWGDGLGPYRVRLYDAADALISEADDVDVSSGGTTIPALQVGKFLTNNGSVLQWASIREVPDPTGQSGKVLGNNGTSAIWQALPTPPDPPDPEIVVTPGSAPALYFQAGVSTDPNKYVEQTGTATVPASGSAQSTVSVTYPVAFSTPPVVHVNATGGVQPGGLPVLIIDGTPSVTGFTIRADVAEGSGANPNITVPIPVNWSARGTRNIP